MYYQTSVKIISSSNGTIRYKLALDDIYDLRIHVLVLTIRTYVDLVLKHNVDRHRSLPSLRAVYLVTPCQLLPGVRRIFRNNRPSFVDRKL